MEAVNSMGVHDISPLNVSYKYSKQHMLVPQSAFKLEKRLTEAVTAKKNDEIQINHCYNVCLTNNSRDASFFWFVPYMFIYNLEF